MNFHRRLIICCSGKYLGLGCRNGRVLFYKFGHHTTQRFNADPQKSQTVAEEVQPGYALKGKVIRPSLVKVFK